jgi:hypothetical protein
MKSPALACIGIAALSGASCSLVTVPVKVAGGIVETTVETTGKVITAPFKAIGGDDKKPQAPSGSRQASQPESTPPPANAGESEE